MRSSDARWLLRDVRHSGDRLDCRIRDGRVVQLQAQLAPADGEQIIDAGGGALLPGLADHHIHLGSAAAARRSLDLGGGGVEGILPEAHAGSGWLRVIGAGVELTRADLDAVWPSRPVRVQHRSGALWTVNSAGLAALAAAPSSEEWRTGQFWRAAGRLRSMIVDAGGTDLAGLAAELASWGVTHVTDATPDFCPATLGTSVRQHVLSLGPSGDGPRKIVIADHVPPRLSTLIGDIRAAHSDGRGVALHVVTAVALAVAQAAFNEAGSNGLDRIEHAAVCDDASAAQLADLGITIVTQPSLLARHGEAYLAESEPYERPLLWRHAGLLRADVRVAVSSDAPYGDANPWRTIQAAATRSCGGRIIAEEERVTAQTALASMLASPHSPGGPPRTVAVGSPADLCLLTTDLPEALSSAVRTGSVPVRATFVAGSCIYLGNARSLGSTSVP
ncbi:MAG TPA: amidohydrolase family protein [Jatrophihabitantaceae bacterium]|jgi:predicted amidohydrolase YtcJ|nr:amidohydrolase family protein [Jatrophihabitantaceae bacterium]